MKYCRVRFFLFSFRIQHGQYRKKNGMLSAAMEKLSEVSCSKRRFDVHKFGYKVKRAFMIKASVWMFTSLIKKLHKVSCSKRLFASSQVWIKSLSRFHVQSVGWNVHKFNYKVMRGFMFKASVRIFTSLNKTSCDSNVTSLIKKLNKVSRSKRLFASSQVWIKR